MQSVETYEIRLETADYAGDSPALELGVWSGGERCHTADVRVVQSWAPHIPPPTLERDPDKFWAAVIHVAAEMLAAELRSGDVALPATLHAHAVVVEQYAQWQNQISRTQPGDVIQTVVADSNQGQQDDSAS